MYQDSAQLNSGFLIAGLLALAAPTEHTNLLEFRCLHFVISLHFSLISNLSGTLEQKNNLYYNIPLNAPDMATICQYNASFRVKIACIYQ